MCPILAGGIALPLKPCHSELIVKTPQTFVCIQYTVYEAFSE